MKQLPDKPSELILVALRDLELVERDPRYRVNMYDWHSYNGFKGVCEVCLAGAVMAKSLDVRFSNSVIPSSLGSEEFTDKLLALDSFRQGEISSGLRSMGLDGLAKQYVKVDIATYGLNPKRFKKTLRKIAKTFEGLGL